MIFLLDTLVPFGAVLRQKERNSLRTNILRVLFYALPLTFFIFWLFSFIPYIGGLIYFLLVVPLSAKQHIAELNVRDAKHRLLTYLTYFVVVIIGFGGFWGFIGHTLLADSVAKSIGWATGSPFQTELAFYHLGLGIAGILVVWLPEIITGLVISKAVFLYGAAMVHVYDAITNKNFAPSNIGAPLVSDIVIPSILLYFLVAYLQRKHSAS